VAERRHALADPGATQQVVTLGLDPLPTPAQQSQVGNGYYGWIRREGEVPTRNSDHSGGACGKALADGEVAYAERTTPTAGLRIEHEWDALALSRPSRSQSWSSNRAEAAP